MFFNDKGKQSQAVDTDTLREIENRIYPNPAPIKAQEIYVFFG